MTLIREYLSIQQGFSTQTKLLQMIYFLTRRTPHSIPSIPERSEPAVLSIVLPDKLPTTPANFRSLDASITINNEFPSSCVVPRSCETCPLYFSSTFLPSTVYVPFTFFFAIVWVKFPFLSNIKYIDNQLVTVIKIQMICKCKYKTI